MSLASRLFVLVLIALLPAVAIQAYNEISLRREREAEAHGHAVEHAQLAASELDRVLEGVRNLLMAIATEPSVRALDAVGCVPYLAALQPEVPHLVSLSAFDRGGRMRCRQSPPPGEVNVSGRRDFQEALRGADFAVDEFTLGSVTGRPVLPLAMPLCDPEGRIIGTVAAALDLAWLTAQLRRRGYPEGGSVTVADRNGVILAREPFPARFIGTRIPEAFLPLVSAPAAGVTEATSQDGTRRVLGYVPVSMPPHGLYVSAGISSEAALAGVNAATRRGIALIAAGFLIAMTAAWLAGRHFIKRPVNRLLAVADAWRGGDLSVRTGLTGREGEIGRLGAAFDRVVDELQRREEALRESEERLRLAVEATGIGTWDVDVVSGARRWSDEFRSILGLPADAPADTETFSSLIHPDDQAWVDERYRKAYAGEDGGAYQAVFRIRRLKDGAERWVMAKGQVTFDAGGRPVRGVGTLLDVTDAKRTEEALAASEERYRLAVTAFHGATYDTDLETEYAYRAPRFYEMLGVRPEDGDPTREWWFSRIHPEDAPRFHAALEALLAGEAAELDLEFRVRHETGGWIWIWQRGLAVRDGDGRVRRTAGAILDITQRKKAEEALRESEARFRHMADSAPALIWMSDASGQIIFANMHYDFMFGRPASEMLGAGWLSVVEPQDLDGFNAAFRTAFEARRPFHAEVRVRDRHGRLRWLRCEGVPRLNDAHEFLGYTGCNVDITDAKVAEQHLRLMVNELNHRVKNTLATVQAMAAQTLRDAASIGEAREAFAMRLRALAEAHDVLTRESWEGADLGDVVHAAIRPHAGGRNRFRVEGPHVRLAPRTALALAMALHELGTNAAKYGALSSEEGRVEIRWRVEGGTPAPRLVMRWTESGGPPVTPPTRRGFGSRLIERGLARELGGEVSIDFRPEGIVCAIDAPLPAERG